METGTLSFKVHMHVDSYTVILVPAYFSVHAGKAPEPRPYNLVVQFTELFLIM